MIVLATISAALAGAIDALPSVVGAPGQPLEQAIVTDLDADGEAEVTIGVPSSDRAFHEAGEAAWIPGARALAPLTLLDDVAAVVLTGEEPQDHAGTSLVASGDLDGDGYPDLAIGAPDASSDEAPVCGKVYIAYGGASGLEGTQSLGSSDAWNGIDRIEGADAWGRIGERVFGAPDLNDDGRDDLLLGAPIPTPSGAPGTGWLGLLTPRARGFAVSTVSFTYGNNDVDQTTVGLDTAWVVGAAGTLAGRSAATVPDVDGDGRADVILGAPGVGSDDAADTGSTGDEASAGAAYLFLGQNPADQAGVIVDERSAVAVVLGEHAGDELPWELLALEDSRVVFAVPQDDGDIGAVYVFDTLYGKGAQVSGDATAGIHGEVQGDLFGRGVADATGLTDGAFLLVGEPGRDGGSGAAVLTREPAGHVGVASVEIGALSGCWTDSEVGSTIRAWRDGSEPVIAITAPFASVYGVSDGLVAILDPEHLSAFDAECTHGDATPIDGDLDGTTADVDCDDAASWRYPGAPEVCGDGVDDDCDGEIDEACGPPAPQGDGCGCSTSLRGAGLAGLLVPAALALARRRRRMPTVLLGCLAIPARARSQELDANAGATYRLWGSAANEYLHGPVLTGQFTNTAGLDIAVANYQGIQTTFASGEVALLAPAQFNRDVWLGDAQVTYYGGSEHDYLGVSALAADEGATAEALYVGIDHTGLTEGARGQVAVFRDPLAAGLPLVIGADDAAYVLEGEDDGDAFGTVMALGGDLDDDGLADLVIGAPTLAYGRDVPTRPESCDPTEWVDPRLVSGAVYIVHDGLAGRPVDPKTNLERIATRSACDPNTIQADRSVATAAITAWDPDEATFFGWRLLSPGDFDRDGTGDLLVASLDADMGGTVYFFPGPIERGDVLMTPDDAQGRWESDEPDLYLGWSLAATEDATTVAIGSPFADAGSGRVWMFDEPPTGSVDVDDSPRSLDGEPGSGFGYSIAWGSTLIIGAPYASEVHVFDEDLQPIALLGGVPSLGSWVGFVGDVTASPDDPTDHGVPDVALVAPSATGELEHQGVALVLSGQRMLTGDFPASSDAALDGDGDGAPFGQDCDDQDPTIAPGDAEICRDGVDNDCDTSIDEDPCDRACGCRGGPDAPLGVTMLGLVLLARRRRPVVVLTAAVACHRPDDLQIEIRDPATNEALDPDHLFGTLQLSAQGDFERLSLSLDGIPLAAGDGPYVRADWDAVVETMGAHEITAAGYTPRRDPVFTRTSITVDPASGDDVAPTVTLVRPSGVEIEAAAPFVISVVATDDRGLSDLVLSLDGQVLVRWTEIASSTFLADAPSTGIVPGNHELSVAATDIAGNVGTVKRSYTATPTYDCKLTEPEAGEIGGTVTLSVDPSDAPADSMAFLWVPSDAKPQAIGQLDGPIVDDLGFVVWSIDWDTALDGWLDGSGTVEVDVRDVKGTTLCSPGAAYDVVQPKTDTGSSP